MTRYGVPRSSINPRMWIFVNNVMLINTTPHEIVFENGEILSPAPPELSRLISGKPTEEFITTVDGIYIVHTTFYPNEDGVKFVEDIKRVSENTGITILLISSMISVNAFGFPVVSPIAVNPRAPPSERKCFIDKFNSR